MRYRVSSGHAKGRFTGLGATGSIQPTCPSDDGYTYTFVPGLGCVGTSGSSTNNSTGSCPSGYTLNFSTALCDPVSGSAAAGSSAGSTAAPAAPTPTSAAQIVIFGGLAAAAIYALTKF